MPRPKRELLSDEQRCIAIKRNGERCGNCRMTGLTVCRTHGGSTPNAKAKSLAARAAKAAATRAKRTDVGAISPIDANDPEARGDIALAMEIRRSIAWIRFCERAIYNLAGDYPDADDALADVLGELQLVGREVVSGIERDFDTHLTTERYAAGLSVWEDRLRWERAHLAALTKQWISAGFEARRLELAERTLSVLERAIDGILVDLGHNPRDSSTRAIVSRRLSETANENISEDGDDDAA